MAQPTRNITDDTRTVSAALLDCPVLNRPGTCGPAVASGVSRTGPRSLGVRELVGDRLLEELRRPRTLHLDAVQEEGRRLRDVQLPAERDVAFDEFERAGVLGVPVGDAADVPGRLTHR